MTAPAVLEPTAAPVAPVVETPLVTAPDPARGLGSETTQSAIDRIIRKPIPSDSPVDAAVAALPGAPAVAPSLGNPEGLAAEVPVVAVEATPPAMVAEISYDEPEGQVVLRARDPVTGQFSDIDQSRVYELSMKDKETGEVRVYNKSLPELTRLAKDGISSQKRMAAMTGELAQLRQTAPQHEQRATAAEARASQLEALALELLTADESLVVERRAQYSSEQTPEKQVARLEAQLTAERAERQRSIDAARTTAQQQGFQHAAATLASRIGPTCKAVEGMVGREAAAGKLALETAHLMVNGQIPPAHFPQLEAYITGPYQQWATAEAAKRTTASSSAAAAQDAARQTQIRAQQAARNIGSAINPTGGMAGNIPLPQAKPKSMTEAMDRIIRGRPVAQTA